MNKFKHKGAKLINRIIGKFGIEIVRKRYETQYWGTGELTPLEENSEEIYNKFYGDKAAIDAYYVGHRMSFYKELVEKTIQNGIILNDRHILDSGCGVGYLLYQVSTSSTPQSLSGSDFSDEAVKASKVRFPNMNFFRHDINLPLDNNYDVIFCTEVLEHLERPWTAIQNLSRGLNRDGCLILTVPNGRRDQNNEHINFWSPESWLAFIKKECSDAKTVQADCFREFYNIAFVQY